MVTVKFHGDLKRFADEPLELCVENFRELMSGLLSQIQGLRQQLRNGYYKVRIGRDRYLSEEQIKSNAVLTLSEDCTVHFTPVVSGAGKGGNVFQIVAGVALIIASIYVPVLAPYSAQLMAVGASLALSGAVGLLSKPPDMNNKLGDSEKQQSTSFSNIRNLTPQGRPIPLLYGKMMTSLILISQGIESFDEITDAQKEEQEKARQKEQAQTEEEKRREAERERIREERAEQARDAREEREREADERREAKERSDRDLAEAAMG